MISTLSLSQLFKDVSNIVTNFDTLSMYDIFLFNMFSSEIDIISTIPLYVDTCFDIRKRFHDYN